MCITGTILPRESGLTSVVTCRSIGRGPRSGRSPPQCGEWLGAPLVGAFVRHGLGGHCRDRSGHGCGKTAYRPQQRAAPGGRAVTGCGRRRLTLETTAEGERSAKKKHGVVIPRCSFQPSEATDYFSVEASEAKVLAFLFILLAPQRRGLYVQ